MARLRAIAVTVGLGLAAVTGTGLAGAGTALPSMGKCVAEPSGLCATTVVNSTAVMPAVQPSTSYNGASFDPSGAFGMVTGSRCKLQCTGVVETTVDGGAHWSASSTGVVVPWLDQVLSPHEAFVAGDRQGARDVGPASYCGELLTWQPTNQSCPSLLESVDGGTSWQPLAIPVGGVSSFSFAGRELGYALTTRCAGTKTTSPNVWPPKGCRYDFSASVDGGHSWREVSHLSSPALSVAAVGNQVWVVEAAYSQPSRAGDVAVLRSTDGGAKWQKMATVAPNDVFAEPTAALVMHAGGEGLLSVFDSGTCAMHGCEAELFDTKDGGATWRQLQVTGPDQECGPGGPLAFALSGTGRLAAEDSVNLAACRAPGSILVAGGPGLAQTKIVTTFPFGRPVSQLAWAGAGRLVDAAGNSLLVSSGSGGDWQQVLPAPVPDEGIDLLSPRDGYGFGLSDNPGAVLATKDGGARWHQVGAVPGEVMSIAFVNTKVGWLVAEPEPFSSTPAIDVYRTTDGGARWSATATISSKAAAAVARFGGMSPAAIGATGTNKATVFVSEDLNYGFPLPEAALVRTSNGGRGWSDVALPVWRQGEAGTAWASASTGWALVGAEAKNGSRDRVMLVATDDGGVRWVKLATLVPPASNGGAQSLMLPGLSTQQVGLGWVLEAGLGEGPEPRRPVQPELLVTSDGALSWSQVNLPSAVGGPVDLDGAATDLGPLAAQVLPGGQMWLLSYARCAPGTSLVGAAPGTGCSDALWHSSDGGARWALTTPS